MVYVESQKGLIIFFLFFILFSNNVFAQPYPWLKKGVYFEYMVSPYGDFSLFYLLRWEIIDVLDDMIVVRLTLLNFSISKTVRVKISTREVFLNDRRIGVTLMFYKTYVKTGTTNFLVKIDNNITSIKVKIDSSTAYTHTPIGRQRVYLLSGNLIEMLYDYDSGILIDDYISERVEEAFIEVFEIPELYYMSFFIKLYSTNADIGPIDILHEIWCFIVYNFPIIFLLASITISLLIIYRRHKITK